MPARLHPFHERAVGPSIRGVDWYFPDSTRCCSSSQCRPRVALTGSVGRCSCYVQGSSRRVQDLWILEFPSGARVQKFNWHVVSIAAKFKWGECLARAETSFGAYFLAPPGRANSLRYGLPGLYNHYRLEHPRTTVAPGYHKASCTGLRVMLTNMVSSCM